MIGRLIEDDLNGLSRLVHALSKFNRLAPARARQVVAAHCAAQVRKSVLLPVTERVLHRLQRLVDAVGDSAGRVVEVAYVSRPR